MTGTFDDWAKSVKLEKKGDRFEKLLDLPQTEEKTFYKVRGVHALLGSWNGLVKTCIRYPRQKNCQSIGSDGFARESYWCW